MSRFDDAGQKRFWRRRRSEDEQRTRLPGDDEPKLPPPVEPAKANDKPGRNDPCPCGSGKKYKKCCGK